MAAALGQLKTRLFWESATQNLPLVGSTAMSTTKLKLRAVMPPVLAVLVSKSGWPMMRSAVVSRLARV